VPADLLDSSLERKDSVPSITATWWCALAAVPFGSVVAQTATAPTNTGTDTQFANYAFASELGSGIYTSSGRTLQVYQFSPSYSLRPAQPRGGRPGIKLIFPLTVGFFNFQPVDLAHGQLPSSIGALSLEPGVELDYWMNDRWHLYPYVKAGGTFASSTEINAVIYGTGVRSDYRFAALDGALLYRAELAYAAVHFHNELANESFTRLRDGLELDRGPHWHAGNHEMLVGPYAFTDIYFNAPEGPASGISARTVQYEGGLMLNVKPAWQTHGWSWPRFGIGYRVAGVLSGWRLVIGDPF
jgi:hypothetical protein